MSQTKPGGRLALWVGVYQVLIGLGAVAGGLGLVLDPSGASLGMERAWLTGTPFGDYLVPGLFLLVVNGLGQLAGAAVTFRRHRRAGDAALLLGAIMVGWIVAQVSWLGYLSWLQPFYFAVGLLELALGWALRRRLASVF